ncbi:MAG: peptidylprolyl isomerase [Polyangiales bacterium]
MVEKLVNDEVFAKLPSDTVTNEKILAYYNEHRGDFSRPEMRRASHILVKGKSEAEALLKTAEQTTPMQFQKLARENSLDTETKQRSGDLSFFDNTGRIPGSQAEPIAPELVRAAYAIREPNAVYSEVVDMGSGNYSIVRLTEIRKERAQPIELASPRILQILLRKSKSEALDHYIGSLKSAAKIEKFLDRMMWIQLPTEPAAANATSASPTTP